MELIMKNNKKCPECGKGYLKFYNRIDDKSFWFLLIPFVKVNCIGYKFECNNCGSIFREMLEESKN